MENKYTGRYAWDKNYWNESVDGTRCICECDPVKKLRKTIEFKNNKIEELIDCVEDQDNRIDEQNERYANLLNKYEKLRDMYEKTRPDSIRDLETTIERQKEEIRHQNESYIALNNEYERMHSESEYYKDTLSSRNYEIDELQDKLAKAKTRIEELERENKYVLTHCDRLKDLMEHDQKARKNLVIEKNEYKKELRRMTQENNNLRAENESLKKSLDGAVQNSYEDGYRKGLSDNESYSELKYFLEKSLKENTELKEKFDILASKYNKCLDDIIQERVDRIKNNLEDRLKDYKYEIKRMTFNNKCSETVLNIKSKRISELENGLIDLRKNIDNLLDIPETKADEKGYEF